MRTFSSFDSSTRCDAFDLAAALDAYAALCTQLVTRWTDLDLYEQAGTAIGAIREHGVPVPSLTVLTLQLAIAHYELEATLWQMLNVEAATEGLQELLDRHALAVQELRSAARETLVQKPSARPVVGTPVGASASA